MGDTIQVCWMPCHPEEWTAVIVIAMGSEVKERRISFPVLSSLNVLSRQTPETGRRLVFALIMH